MYFDVIVCKFNGIGERILIDKPMLSSRFRKLLSSLAGLQLTHWD